jgi:hypothetical protein
MEITADRGETVSDLESLDSTITPPPRWTPDSDNAKLTQTAVRATTDNFDATGNSPVLTVAVECDKKCRDLVQASGSCETSLVDTSDPDVFTELPATAGRQLLGRAPPSPTGAPTAAPTACSTSSGSSGSSGSSTSSTAGCVHPAATYLASLIAGTSSIYSRDLGVSLQVKYMKVWSGNSPFDAGTNSLNDLVSASSSVTGTKKDADIAHLFTGIVEGGLAYVGTACDNNGYNTGVSSIRGNWGGSLNANAYNWDLIVTSHELGHNVGSGHTHSYNPPIDQCVVGGSAVSRSSSNCVRGTIMSYCHLCGGIANVDMKLDPRVITKIKTNLGSSSGRCKLSGI